MINQSKLITDIGFGACIAIVVFVLGFTIFCATGVLDWHDTEVIIITFNISVAMLIIATPGILTLLAENFTKSKTKIVQ